MPPIAAVEKLRSASRRSLAELDALFASLWLKQAEVDDVGGTPEMLSTVEREELARLRRENRRLLEEREIQKKAAAFFARESS